MKNGIDVSFSSLLITHFLMIPSVDNRKRMQLEKNELSKVKLGHYHGSIL